VCFDLASLDLVYQNRLISRKTYQQIKGAIKYNKSTIELLFAGKISEEDIKALSYEQSLNFTPTTAKLIKAGLASVWQVQALTMAEYNIIAQRNIIELMQNGIISFAEAKAVDADFADVLYNEFVHLSLMHKRMTLSEAREIGKPELSYLNAYSKEFAEDGCVNFYIAAFTMMIQRCQQFRITDLIQAMEVQSKVFCPANLGNINSETYQLWVRFGNKQQEFLFELNKTKNVALEKSDLQQILRLTNEELAQYVEVLKSLHSRQCFKELTGIVLIKRIEDKAKYWQNCLKELKEIFELNTNQMLLLSILINICNKSGKQVPKERIGALLEQIKSHKIWALEILAQLNYQGIVEQWLESPCNKTTKIVLKNLSYFANKERLIGRIEQVYGNLSPEEKNILQGHAITIVGYTYEFIKKYKPVVGGDVQDRVIIIEHLLGLAIIEAAVAQEKPSLIIKELRTPNQECQELLYKLAKEYKDESGRSLLLLVMKPNLERQITSLSARQAQEFGNLTADDLLPWLETREDSLFEALKQKVDRKIEIAKAFPSKVQVKVAGHVRRASETNLTFPQPLLAF
jgi:hypothetical protein